MTQPAFTLEELTVISSAIAKDLEAPGEWHFINKSIAESIQKKIAAACRLPDVTPTD